MKSSHSLRIGALAAALVMAVSSLHAADAPADIAKPKASFVGAGKANATYDRFIVTYKDGSSERGNRNAALQTVQAAVDRAGLGRASAASAGAAMSPLSVSYQRKLAVGADLVRTSRKLSPQEANALMAQIAADPAVAHVQPDYKMYAVKDLAAPASIAAKQDTQPRAFMPDDTYYAKYQWHFSNAIGGANVNNAWDVADGSGITVAVLDTGITRHPDLDMSLADAGYDFIDDALVSGRAADGRVPGGWDLGDWTTSEPWLSECTDAQNPPEDSSWHGTHVSGTIAELTNNGQGMAGIAYNAKVLPVRVLGHCGGYTSDIADAIEWASGGHVDGVPDNTHVAQVINMSLGGGGQCDADGPEAVAIRHAISRGTSVVVAAGNASSDVSNFSPASCPGVITVAANGIAGKRAFYSNYGSGVTLSAPGGGIYADDASSGQVIDEGFVWSSINEGTTEPANATYGGMAGTSQATPHVSGAVAMMLSAAKAAGLPQPSPAQVKEILAKSARPLPAAADQPIGAGILDAYNAVKMTVEGAPQDDAQPLSKGVLTSGQSNGAGRSTLYAITVPVGARSLNIRTLGGSGSVVLHVKAGSSVADDGSNADFSSAKPGTSQAVVISEPQATTYYVRVSTETGYNNISVLADYTSYR